MNQEIATANLSNDGFIELIFLRENFTLDVREVADGWEKAKKLSPEKKAMVLLKTGKLTLLDKEARNFVMSELKTWPVVAVIVDNLGQRLMGQVVINMTDKKNQIKLFNSELKAKDWLKRKISLK